MKVLTQTVAEVIGALSPLPVDWMDKQAADAIAALTALPVKDAYTYADIEALLDHDFDVGILCCRTFLAIAKDSFDAVLKGTLGAGGFGVTRYRTDKRAFLDALAGMGLLDTMAVAVNHKSVWSDVMVERLRAGRGSAISGQRRGLGLETFAEAVVKEVFGEGSYEMRATFTGTGGKVAKCDWPAPIRWPRFEVSASSAV